jgi:hypothetical protein
MKELELEVVEDGVVAYRLRVWLPGGVLLFITSLGGRLPTVLLVFASLRILTNCHA